MSERPPRLDARAILAELAEELLSLDRGLPFTLWQLVRHPGHAVRRYIEYRDPRMVRPFRLALGALAFAALAFALAGASGSFATGFRAGFEGTQEAGAAVESAGSGALEWLLAHQQWLLLLVWVPATAAAIGRAYRLLGLNIAEQSAIALYALVPPLLLAGLLVLLPLPGSSAAAALLVVLLPSLWAAWLMHRYARPESLSVARVPAFVLLQWMYALLLLLFVATGALAIALLNH